MPVYDFVCPICGAEKNDVLMKMTSVKADYPYCDGCSEYMEKKVSKANASFKGSGFHATDYHAPTRGF